MTLLKQVSDRLDSKGRNYLDYYLGWIYEGKFCWVRVRASFIREHKYLYAVAINVPRGEPIEKYID